LLKLTVCQELNPAGLGPSTNWLRRGCNRDEYFIQSLLCRDALLCCK
jgi:hypothetical protein